MKLRIYILLITSFLLSSCEDIIDINLNDAAAQLVIVGEIHNRSDSQVVTISKTVAFKNDIPFDGVSNARVEVIDEQGNIFTFTEQSPGVYIAENFWGMERVSYDLHVQLDGEEYTASSRMPQLVQVDSVGTSVTNIFGEERKYVSLKYLDPLHEVNYYRYTMRVNNGPVRFVHVANDKFNDGKYVSERLTNFDEELVTGDSVVLYMQCIDEAMFNFWNTVQTNNPGAAAPANPPSNISNGAFGYFGAYSATEIVTEIK